MVWFYANRLAFIVPSIQCHYLQLFKAGDELEISDDKFRWKDLMTNNIVHVGNKKSMSNINENHPTPLMKNGFDPRLFWGDAHVLPRIEASGRWENFPVCRHPGVGYEKNTDSNKNVITAQGEIKDREENTNAGNDNVAKKHKLTACLWAAASFTTRGDAQAVSDTTKRLVEWIEFHLLVGFDHVYVYDNTGAHTNETSLESTLFPRFLDSEVTRIDWVRMLYLCV